jgi:hypothetical protein
MSSLIRKWMSKTRMIGGYNSFIILVFIHKGCFRKHCCYLPSCMAWLIAARDARFPRGGRWASSA